MAQREDRDIICFRTVYVTPSAAEGSAFPPSPLAGEGRGEGYPEVKPKGSFAHRSALIAKPFLFLILILSLISGCTTQTSPPVTRETTATSGASGTSQPTWQVYFSPDGGATDAVIETLGAAKQTVLVQAYSFTSIPIAKALYDAKKRGVDVQVIMDDSNLSSKYSTVDFLSNTGVPLFIDSEHAIAHNKIMIIDGETVITGSFNFTKSAEERNAENLLIIKDEALAKEYTENWQEHKAHSERHTGKY